MSKLIKITHTFKIFIDNYISKIIKLIPSEKKRKKAASF